MTADMVSGAQMVRLDEASKYEITRPGKPGLDSCRAELIIPI